MLRKVKVKAHRHHYYKQKDRAPTHSTIEFQQRNTALAKALSMLTY